MHCIDLFYTLPQAFYFALAPMLRDLDSLKSAVEILLRNIIIKRVAGCLTRSRDRSELASPFFKLPIELRDIIYYRVLFHTLKGNEVGSDHLVLKERRNVLDYLSDHPCACLINLFLVNRTICIEASSVLARQFIFQFPSNAICYRALTTCSAMTNLRHVALFVGNIFYDSGTPGGTSRYLLNKADNLTATKKIGTWYIACPPLVAEYKSMDQIQSLHALSKLANLKSLTLNVHISFFAEKPDFELTVQLLVDICTPFHHVQTLELRGPPWMRTMAAPTVESRRDEWWNQASIYLYDIMAEAQQRVANNKKAISMRKIET